MAKSSKEKEQPDELFRKKLENFDTPVRAEVWDRLSRQRTPERPLWYGKRALGAAVIAGLLLGGGIWTTIRKGEEKASLAASEKLSGEATAGRKKADGYEGKEAGRQEEKTAFERKAASGHTEEPAGKTTLSRERAIASAKSHSPHPDITSQVPAIPVSGETGREIVLAGVAEEAGPGAAAVPGPAEEQSREAPGSAGGTRVLVVYVSPPPAGEPKQETHYAVVAEEKGEAPGPGKKKGLQRFFRQLKNAKTGEKIDWNELGFNPHRVFANVDHQLGSEPAVQYDEADRKPGN